MISYDTKIAIIGLGLLGGSYAKGFNSAGYENLIGIDIDDNATSLAKESHLIKDGGNDPSMVKDCDIIISCLYPHVFVQWVKENQKYFKSGALLTDVTGVKRAVIAKINEELRSDVEFIACHPMAGREYKGILYSDASRFLSANFIIVPTEKNSSEALNTARQIAEILRFGRISTLSPEEHDRMIGYLSQLTHVIAVSLMNANDNTDLAEYSGDSFRDLTRIAKINEDLWPELFILNKDNLCREIDVFTQEMLSFRDLVEKEDIEGMKEKLRQSTERRKLFDRK